MSKDNPFKLGQHFVNEGDTVWTDLIEAERPPGWTGLPLVRKVPISGIVLRDGSVRLSNGVIVNLNVCRLAEKVIRL